MMKKGWGIDNPRPYQVEAIFRLAFCRMNVHLIRKCGEGKSAVLYGMASLLRGITVCMVPLIGLGSDQVSKSKRPDINQESYHVDEFRGKDFDKLAKRVKSSKPGGNDRIILFISPQELKEGTKWYSLLVTLANAGLISAF